jgi:methionyl-tRNA formyltransferase
VRVVFLASGAFAIPSLEALLGAGHEVAALVTQPDRESGRGRALAPPPVKPVAERHGVRVLQLARVREPLAQATLRELRPQIQVVVAFGQILPRAVIDIAPHGTLNVHASLLPRLRGAAPIQWAIANGDEETGVTTMQIDEGLDTGPLLLARPLAIAPDETAAELEPRLARLGGELLVETLAGLAKGTLRPLPQDASRATYAPILRKQDGRVDWSLPAHAIACRARGFQPWPGAFTQAEGRLLKLVRVHEAAPAEATGAAAAAAMTAGEAEPGQVKAVSAAGVLVACGAGTALHLDEVQPESRRAMPAGAWAQGSRLRAGARLG